MKLCDECKVQYANNLFDNETEKCKICVLRNAHQMLINKMQLRIQSLEAEVSSLKDESRNKRQIAKPPSPVDTWTMAKKSANRIKKIRPLDLEQRIISTKNRFGPLNEVETEEIVIYSDESLVGAQDEFVTRDPRKRKMKYIPKFKVKDLDYIDFDQDSKKSKVFALGNSDIIENKEKRKDILIRYESFLKNLKNKEKVIVMGTLPTNMNNYNFLNQAFNWNLNLKFICNKIGIKFVNYWDSLYTEGMYEGSYLTPWGKARLGRLLNESVINFFFLPKKRTITRY